MLTVEPPTYTLVSDVLASGGGAGERLGNVIFWVLVAGACVLIGVGGVWLFSNFGTWMAGAAAAGGVLLLLVGYVAHGGGQLVTWGFWSLGASLVFFFFAMLAEA